MLACPFRHNQYFTAPSFAERYGNRYEMQCWKTQRTRFACNPLSSTTKGSLDDAGEGLGGDIMRTVGGVLSREHRRKGTIGREEVPQRRGLISVEGSRTAGKSPILTHSQKLFLQRIASENLAYVLL